MTLPLRRVVFWMHLIAGVCAGAVILLMSVTGVLLAYEKQMVRWADGFHAPPPAPGQPRLPLEDLIARARDARPGPPPASVIVRREESSPVEIGFGREGSLFLNAYTGEVLGPGSTRTRAFFRSVMEWHRWLALKDAQRATGKMVTGVANLAFFFIVLSGFYLWWPRTWTWTQFRQVLWFRGRLHGKARDFNWHHVIGYWSLVPLAVIVWSGVVIGYPWASDLTYRLAGEAPPRPPAQGAPRPGEGPAGPAQASAGHQPMATLLTQAGQRSPDWTILTMRVPTPKDRAVQVTVDTGTGAQPQKKATLVLDRETGATRQWEPFAAQTPGRQWRAWMRFAHTGEYYGLTGQTIAMLVTAGSVVLVWTGLALTWRRFTAWRARRPAAARGARAA